MLSIYKLVGNINGFGILFYFYDNLGGVYCFIYCIDK